MRVVDSRADVKEDTNSLFNPKGFGLAIARNPAAVDVLHYKIRSAVCRSAPIEEPSDVGMIEPAQDLSLPTKTRQDKFGIHVRAHHFNRDLLLKLPVGSLGKIHCAHSATADLLQQTIWSQSGINRRRFI